MCFASQSRQRGVSEAEREPSVHTQGEFEYPFVLCRFQIAPVVALDLVSVKVLRDVGAKVRDEDNHLFILSKIICKIKKCDGGNYQISKKITYFFIKTPNFL